MPTKKDPKTTAKSTSTEKKEPSLIADNSVLTLTIPWVEVNTAYQKQLRLAAKQLKSPGFRRGKVPLSLAEQMVDSSKLVERTLQELLPERYAQVMMEEKKQPLTNPDIRPISIERNKDWQIEIHYAEAPVIKLGDYKKIVTEAKKAAAKDIAEREAELKKNASATKKTTKSTSAPAITELTKDQKEEVNLQHIFRELAVTLKPAIPELLVREQTRTQIHNLVHQLEPLKISLDDYLKRRGITFETLSQETAAQALGQLQLDFILREIVVTEKLTATDEEVANHLKENQDDHQHDHDHNHDHDDRYKGYLKENLTRKKVIDHLLAL